MGMSSSGEGMECGLIESVKCSILRWFCHLERPGSEVTNRICMSKIEAVGARRQPPVKWEDNEREERKKIRVCKEVM